MSVNIIPTDEAGKNKFALKINQINFLNNKNKGKLI